MNTAPSAHARLTQIAAALRARAPSMARRDPPFFEAAVALVLRTTADRIELLFIKRAARDSDAWSGQIALPGGRHDPTDKSLEATAVRETLEEVALDLHRDGTIIGVLDEIRPRTPVLPPVIVRPFVATIAPGVTPRLSDEVADLFWAPLDAILESTATVETEIEVRGLRTRRPAISYGGHIIWGMTERILRNFADVVA